MTPAVEEYVAAAQALAQSKRDYAEAFLRAKASRKDVTDGMARAMATIETGSFEDIAEAHVVIAHHGLGIAAREIKKAEREHAFWSRVKFTADCWLWLGSADSTGRGLFRRTTAPRAAWEMVNGPIPNGLIICHECDNPPCVRPDHLWLGTDTDNMRDRDTKGRQARGETNGMSKLSAAQVIEIRARRAAGESCTAIAKSIGVSKGTVSKVALGQAWRHVIEESA